MSAVILPGSGSNMRESMKGSARNSVGGRQKQRRTVREAGDSASMLGVALLLLCLLSPTTAERTAANTVAKVYWKLECRVNHRLKDDPIVLPGKPGQSHSHDFFGSTIVNAYTSKTSQLLRGNTSCVPSGAKNGYWIPTLYRYNATTKQYYPEPPRVITPYYFNRYHGDLSKTVKPPPQGLRMVCGNPNAGPNDTPPSVVEWFCQEQQTMGNRTKYRNIPRKCQGLVMARVYCPSCWDGVHTDSRDHRSHMAYIDPVTTECPLSHPQKIPEIHVTLTYNFNGAFWPKKRGVRNKANPPTAKLSTMDGGGWQLHVDVWEAWDQETLNHFMKKCFYGGMTCGPDAETDVRPRRK